mmetsp:Transcript_20382/g.30143  ORF Transcript_20382/g.30143 Transcript_20382/m.30143 type:complete len:203 (-) Transcript_20382:77-685(-)|eukprot:CAMPEP_0171457434 /NCGR_PEP_ID=MMETSP0945-20130129/3520_1 /TAXON_ID=109269 /ORGANISM="Vaucheria litorea, Strain CCMP2940" /LENGTH=202 /DNA_ID=CAMNT_0011983053 /DNA_START=48 /DNA_END=656 /DNA_ORIENTATION=+
MGNKFALEEEMINLKLTSKQMQRASVKCEKEEKISKGKVKLAIQKGNMEGARIEAQNAIRLKAQALNYLRLSSRVDAVAGRLETAIRMKQVNKSMVGVVKGMKTALKTMDVEKINATMETFEKQFEDMDIVSGQMENSMGTSMAMSTPQDQVDNLVQMVADEHGLEVSHLIDDAGTVSNKVPQPQALNPMDDLNRRMAELRK